MTHRFFAFIAFGCLVAACSSPATSNSGGAADVTATDFDAYTFHSDVGKSDAAKSDATQPDANKADADASPADANEPADATPGDVSGHDAGEPDDTAVLDALDDAADDTGATDTALDVEDATSLDDADAVGDGGGPIKPFAHLCDPCTTDDACNAAGQNGNKCISAGENGSFCGVACSPTDTTSCPDYSTCQTVPGGGDQCQPTSGVCTCTLDAAIAQLSTTCSVTNALGTCLGTRSCGVSGLGKCTAFPAMDEVCDGADNNCNGQTDEGLCTGNSCLAGTCNANTGVCEPAPNGTACDDSNNCTSGDACSFGTCVGTGPDDGNNTEPGTSIQNKSDCDNTSGMQSAILPGSDIDWFTFKASDDVFCSIYPSVRVDQMAGDYDLCVYWACKNGTSDSGVVNCNQGSQVSNGPNGWWGCCSSNTGLTAEKIKIDSQCTPLGVGDDGGTALIEIKAHAPKAANICGGYRLTWSAASF